MREAFDEIVVMSGDRHSSKREFAKGIQVPLPKIYGRHYLAPANDHGKLLYRPVNSAGDMARVGTMVW
jgi:hypothetical protein